MSHQRLPGQPEIPGWALALCILVLAAIGVGLDIAIDVVKLRLGVQ